LTVTEPLRPALSDTDAPASAENLKPLPPSLHSCLIWPPTRKALTSASAPIEAVPLYLMQGLPSLSQAMVTSTEPLTLTLASSSPKLPTLTPFRAPLMASLIGLVTLSGTLILREALSLGSHLHCCGGVMLKVGLVEVGPICPRPPPPPPGPPPPPP